MVGWCGRSRAAGGAARIAGRGSGLRARCGDAAGQARWRCPIHEARHQPCMADDPRARDGCAAEGCDVQGLEKLHQHNLI